MTPITLSVRQAGPTRQRGAMTLLMSLIILTLITFVTLYTARTVSLEQKISGNTVQSRMAFEAAEAGMEAAISYAANGGVDRVTTDTLDTFIFKNDALVAAENNDDADDTDRGDSQTMTFTDGSSVVVEFQGDTEEFLVVAVGTSGDGSASRTIEQTLTLLQPFPSPPGMPMISKGSVGMGGSATIYNFEGETSVWTGDDAGAKASSSMKSAVASIFDTTNYPECLGGKVYCTMQSRTAGSTSGGDINEYDDNLKNMSEDEFFQNFFGLSPDDYRDVFDIAEMTPTEFGNLTDGTLPDSNIIWVTGDVTSAPGVEFGCVGGIDERSTGGWNNVPSYDANDASNDSCSDANLDPYIIIVDGAFDANGWSSLGILYATGEISLSGNSYIEGLVMTAGGTGTISGSLDIWYNSAYLDALNDDSKPAATSGTWHDF